MLAGVPTAGAAAPSAPDPGPGPSTLRPSQDAREALPDADDVVDQVPEQQRDRVLGDGWEGSADRAWTLAGDAGGLHVLVADAAAAYAWRTVATLGAPGFDTDRWIGNACATGSGQRLVVAYAPRSFTNASDLFLRGAFTAVVDLGTGAVRTVGVTSSLEYFSPSCGRDERALLTVSGDEELGATRLVTLDAVTGELAPPLELPGQLTSAVRTVDGIVAASGTSVVRVADDGAVVPLARTASVPYRLTADAEGGVVFLDHDGDEAAVHRLAPSRVRTPAAQRAAPELARGALTEVGVAGTVDGDVLLTGDVTVTGTLPRTVDVVDVPKGAVPTVHGEALVQVVEQATNTAAVDGAVDPTVPRTRLDLTLHSRATGRSQHLSVVPDAGASVDDATGVASSAAVPGAVTGQAAVAAAQPAGDPANPVETERTCAVPRNDPGNQALQPKPRQVEWAVNQAVNNALTVQRPANWKQLGMAAYTPQGMFPPVALVGGGQVPSQVMLGILAQESNLWQVPGYALPGLTGSPLIGNYYGQDVQATGTDRWAIDWSKSDCGYGVSQVTDGMRKADTGVPGSRTYAQQRAIALDFAANVAAGLQILEAKWNETRSAGLTVNDGNSARIENWFFAVWAYNSGFYPEAAKNVGDRNGAWGVGWANNPANASYPPDRLAFMEDAYDATHPQDWPYPEKVMGFAAHPPSLLESPGVYVPAFRAASWNGEAGVAEQRRAEVKPPIFTFCTATNSCVPHTSHVDSDGYDWGPCGHRGVDGDYNGHCWYHGNATWKPDCTNQCGRPFLRFVVGYEYQADGTSYPPSCTTSGLPTGALVVDDVPDAAPDPRCAPPTTNAGAFSLRFNGPGDGTYPSKSDFHQLGGGYGGHFWFGHARHVTLRQNTMAVTGTWTLGRSLNQWTRVLVHLPDLGAHTQQARYQVDLGNGVVKTRYLLQRTMKNGWVSLGTFKVAGVPKVTLTTVTENGDGSVTENGQVVDIKNEDVAFDAVAFVPLAAKPRNFVVALGDSYSSGEGGTRPGQFDYYKETDNNGGNDLLRNACHRSPYTWSRAAVLPDSAATIGARADALDPAMDYHLLACSGAEVHNVLATAVSQPARSNIPLDAWGHASTGQNGELTQLDRGFLDENTTLVTMSIGGNDAGFAKIVSACVLSLDPLLSCQFHPETSGGGPTWSQSVPHNIANEVEDSVLTALQEVHRLAPNAKVMLMGYPQLLGAPPCVVGIYPNETDWLNGLAGELVTHMGEAATRANAGAPTPWAKIMDPRADFAGKAICGNPESVHGLIAAKAPGEGTGWIPPNSQQSFHPKIEGYQLYANVLSRAVAAP
jgi:hypothetical protein